MTATITSLLQPLKDRLAAATPGPWYAEKMRAHSDDVLAESEDGPIVIAEHAGCDAEFIAAAPTDQAKLIAAVEAAEALAAAWLARGESLKSFAKASPEDVQDSLNDQGDDLLWHANLVRSALTQALGGDTA